MHIPDGYLSPATCAVFYAGSAPFWYAAIKRLKRVVSSRLIPLISLFAAFAFVVMMFNLPLPGGTTGHAVGMGIGAVVLGPWASLLAISVALAIQAMFFGDGGITAYGANCFNMAIVGSLTAYTLYRLLAGQAPIASPRRVVAAAIAGYSAINLSALCAAVEFGVQPMLFKDVNGAPLYAPYPLSVAVPAMLLGHLSFAGLAEAIISGGLVAYLQRSDPALLELTARGASRSGIQEDTPRLAHARRLWIGLATLMIATPLGLLAAGSAWGEWSASDFGNPAARQQMMTASHNVPPPAGAPAGLVRLSSFWTAPIPDYAPRFMKDARLGYILSAMFGGGIILSVCLVAGRLLQVNPNGVARDKAS